MEGDIKKYERDEEKYSDAETEEENNFRMRKIIEIAYWTGRIEVLSRFLKGKKELIPSEFI
jgi:hypothetical protein